MLLAMPGKEVFKLDYMARKTIHIPKPYLPYFGVDRFS